MKSRIDPQVLGANCASCPFAKDGKPNLPVGAEGPPVSSCKGVLVGESPGGVESDTGRPFQGPTGEWLNTSLAKASINRDSLLVINTIACQPTVGGKTESNMSAALAACRPVFEAQIKEYYDAKLPMFAGGKWAWRGIVGFDGRNSLPKGGLGKGRGFLRTTGNGTWYIASWHPTYAYFHNPYEWGAFEIDVQRFGRLIRNELRKKPARLITSPTVEDILNCPVDGWVSPDIETAPENANEPWTGKDPTRARIKVVGLGNPDWGLSFEWVPANQHLIDAYCYVLEHYVTVWMNGPWFDHRVLRRYGAKIGRWEDIRDERKALVTTSSPALAYQASLHDDAEPWKESEEDDDKGIVFTDDMEVLKRYNAQDCVEQARCHVANTHEPQWATPRVQRIYEMRKKLAVISAKMHTRGIHLDKKKRYGLSKGLEALHNQRKFGPKVQKDPANPRGLIPMVNIPAFKGGPDDMRALLFKRHATEEIARFNLDDPISDEYYTDTGLCSVDKGSLLALVVNPMVPADCKKIIYQYWTVEAPRKAKSTFVESELVDQALGPDGRIRPGWNSGAAHTLRWSCSKPNVMTLSKEKD